MYEDQACATDENHSNESRIAASPPGPSKGVEHSADDKQIGGGLNFSFILRSKDGGNVGEHSQRYVQPVPLQDRYGGTLGMEAPVRALHHTLIHVYHVQGDDWACRPKPDVMVSFHRISMKSPIPDDVDIHGRMVQFVPEHSFTRSTGCFQTQNTW